VEHPLLGCNRPFSSSPLFFCILLNYPLVANFVFIVELSAFNYAKAATTTTNMGWKKVGPTISST
jgi:hypothetical protein